MAFGGRYQVSAYLMHSTLNAAEMAEHLPTLIPDKLVTAGELSPRHKKPASCSVWMTTFNPEFIDSEEHALSSYLLVIVDRLIPYRKFFEEVGERGEACLEIAWFAHSSHSVAVLSPQIVTKVSQTGLTLDLQLYWSKGGK